MDVSRFNSYQIIFYKITLFFVPSQMLILTCMDYVLYTQSKSSIIEVTVRVLYRVESKVIRLITSPPLTECLQFLTPLGNAASLAIFHHCFHGYCSSDLNCSVDSPCSISTQQDFQHIFISFPFSSLLQELISIFTPSSPCLVNTEMVFLASPSSLAPEFHPC